MMNSKMFILGIASAAFLASCNQKEKTTETTDAVSDSATVQTVTSDSITKATPTAAGDTSENALDWPGTYEAVIPCADCPGIKTSLTLNNDKTFSITEEYVDRNSKNQDKGTFQWDAAGSVITLKGKTANYKYKVGENILIQLDMDGQEITGPNKDLYVFKKK
ncbi:copper resistance protein NlpE [Chryseobacterium sp. W4I1]|uniref:copper resistance protein NlpE n=1 Tax=Chryseobacterium sp. W4I1 TaxID=3042293 RepID=UPI002787BF68|nr:copper resistance protein NlpE [Chryseobacterium sp. W4I1]MDQ0780506.1 putative lipoprotein NlpE involved in copper resistance [Chryseobacterium sp. W4I1]